MSRDDDGGDKGCGALSGACALAGVPELQLADLIEVLDTTSRRHLQRGAHLMDLVLVAQSTWCARVQCDHPLLH